MRLGASRAIDVFGYLDTSRFIPLTLYIQYFVLIDIGIEYKNANEKLLFNIIITFQVIFENKVITFTKYLNY